MPQMKKWYTLFFKIFQIQGNSLFPDLKEKERILCIKNFFFIPLKVGDFVVFEKEKYGLMIKKISKIQNNQLFLLGTDSSSVDSRVFGLIPKDEILYKAIKVLQQTQL
ncbi:MAG: S24/S26 family peptidase [Campylobacterales bacterium]|nr:S24/S26 family peptidase [Campylobacterales bacterium]